MVTVVITQFASKSMQMTIFFSFHSNSSFGGFADGSWQPSLYIDSKW